MKRTCQKCPERATLHITEINPQGYEEVHLCQKCATKYLAEADDGMPPPKDVVSGMLKSAEDVVSTAECPLCGTSFADFRSTGRLGCPHDYRVFGEELRPLLENIHGRLRHIGKVPRRLPPDAQMQAKLLQLRQELQRTVAVEDYERAAQLRDEIDTLEQLVE